MRKAPIKARRLPGYSETKAKIKDLKVSPKKITFGTLKPLEASSPKTVTIHNPNSIAIDVTSISSSNPEFVPTTGCVASLPAGGECEMSVVFTPSSDGKKSAKLTIVHEDGKTLSVKMEGDGKGAPVPTPTVTATATPTPTATATATATSRTCDRDSHANRNSHCDRNSYGNGYPHGDRNRYGHGNCYSRPQQLRQRRPPPRPQQLRRLPPRLRRPHRVRP